MTNNIQTLVTHQTSQQALADLITGARRKETGAFKELYHLHVNMVYGLCLRLCADKSLAEDATQEVFIQLWQKLDNFDGKSKFSTWLHSVASNICISYIRKQKGWWQKVVSIVDSTEHQQADLGSIADTEFEAYIYRLPERARWVFVLHALEGYRHEEIAKMLNMAPATSKVQFHRARKMMEEWINE
ncbi:RNA polymerase sigma factor [Glaciecola sp. XM2]|jgi:RNA polymerase sigma-70 factor (ECF subfamily)|uniref:RNA polymerase sigma factor n=1 Tax=Glaciecola sp. XM2 TaxID=1914931 RepID=UPI001BDEFD53|nr:RNA polymerase sigma factor [Glaciecola sp. XM2]MBT1449961.1 RNA polymerase sigma factor [Glaciecola sp. XM2]